MILTRLTRGTISERVVCFQTGGAQIHGATVKSRLVGENSNTCLVPAPCPVVLAHREESPTATLNLASLHGELHHLTGCRDADRVLQWRH